MLGKYCVRVVCVSPSVELMEYECKNTGGLRELIRCKEYLVSFVSLGAAYYLRIATQ